MSWMKNYASQKMPKITADQLNKINVDIQSYPYLHEIILDTCGIDCLEQLPAAWYDEVIHLVELRKKTPK